METANIVLCEKDNGETFTLKKGMTGRIELMGNPTTGYSWRIQNQVGNSIELGKWTYSPSPISPTFVGSGGLFQIDFQVISDGMTTLYLVYDSPMYPRKFGYSYYLNIDARE